MKPKKYKELLLDSVCGKIYVLMSSILLPDVVVCRLYHIDISWLLYKNTCCNVLKLQIVSEVMPKELLRKQLVQKRMEEKKSQKSSLSFCIRIEKHKHRNRIRK